MKHECEFPKLDTDRDDYKIRLSLYYNADRGPRRGYFLSITVIKQEDRFWLAAPLHKANKLMQLEHVERFVPRRWDEWQRQLPQVLDFVQNPANERQTEIETKIGAALDNAIALAPTVTL